MTSDLCTVYLALSLVRDGYEVQVVADGGTSPTTMTDDIALCRMDKAGVELTTTNQTDFFNTIGPKRPVDSLMAKQ